MTSILKRLSLNEIVLFGLICIAFASSGASVINNASGYTAEWRMGWLQNFSTEVFGAIMTFLLFELLVGRQKEERDTKARLVREAGSTVNAVAMQAIYDLREHAWLHGDRGLLKGASLSRANLTGVSLEDSNLEGATLHKANLIDSELIKANFKGANLREAKLANANLMNANLQEATLWEAQLEDANLQGAKLKGARLQGAQLNGANLAYTSLADLDLGGADLTNANLKDVDCEGADLGQAKLEGANLWKAKLKNTNLRKTTFNDKTILPDAKWIGAEDDGSFIYDKYWTPDTDMTRYTDPNHPNFWQPDGEKK